MIHDVKASPVKELLIKNLIKQRETPTAAEMCPYEIHQNTIPFMYSSIG